MAQHIIVVERKADLEWAKGAGIAVTPREYVSTPGRYGGRQARIINLSGQMGYMRFGYYCSLLAEARQQKVIPNVETILKLSRKSLYEVELPELNAGLRKEMDKLAQPPRSGFTITICFGQTLDTRFRAFARQVFDRFRSPILKAQIVLSDRWRVESLDTATPSELSADEVEFFLAALERYTRADWRAPRAKAQPRYYIGVLHDPAESMPPSNPEALKKLVSVGNSLGIGVEPIQRRDYMRVGEYDALFIRETTSISNHTFRFAQKAEHEGLVVIDDPISILRCTNKVYLTELLNANRLPTPQTLIIDSESLLQAEEKLGYPLVLKIPDGSFSRGVSKANNRAELLDQARKLFRRSSLILAQQYMYTEFDWRVGILGRQPLFVSQYFMSRKHWQVVDHRPGGKIREGGWRTLAVDEAPKEVVETALKAANLIGDGLYGVDLKQTENGVFIIEINDNPNLDRGVEDVVLKDELYRIVLSDLVRRIETR